MTLASNSLNPDSCSGHNKQANMNTDDDTSSDESTDCSVCKAASINIEQNRAERRKKQEEYFVNMGSSSESDDEEDEDEEPIDVFKNPSVTAQLQEWSGATQDTTAPTPNNTAAALQVNQGELSSALSHSRAIQHLLMAPFSSSTQTPLSIAPQPGFSQLSQSAYNTIARTSPLMANHLFNQQVPAVAAATTAQAVAPAVATAKASTKQQKKKRKKAEKSTKKSETTATEEQPVKEPAAKKPRRKKEDKPPPPELAGFRYEHRKRMTFGEEMDTSTKDKTKMGPWRVAVEIHTGSTERGNKKVWALNDLLSNQIRELAKNFGCTKLGSASKFLCRQEMAKRHDLGDMHTQVNQPSVRTTAQEKKTNALFRIIDVCFHPANHQKLTELNDSEKRKDFEEAKGSNPFKEFWIEVAEMVNDSEEEEVTLVLESRDGEDEYLHQWVSDGTLNLTDFNQQTWQTCQQSFVDLMKCRQEILKSKKESGEHSNNTMDCLTGAKKHTQPRKGVNMPKEAVYCLDKHCEAHLDIDQSYTTVLADWMSSDSSIPLDKDEKKASVTKVKEEFLSAVKESNEELKTASNKAYQQREEMLSLQRESQNATRWKEYTDLAERCMSPPEGSRIRKNVAKRVIELEGKLGISGDETVVDEDDIPPSTTSDSNS